MKDHIDPAEEVTTEQWTGYGPVAKELPDMVRISSGEKGVNFPKLHSRAIMMLKAWF